VKTDPTLSEELDIQPGLGTGYFGFTMTKPPLDNVLVRKALSAAIDRQTFIETVLKGGQTLAHSFAPPGIFGSVADDPTVGAWMLDHKQGKELAQEWMAEAGYPEGEGLELLLMYMESKDILQMVEAVHTMWKEAFPKATFTPESQEWMVFLQTVQRETPIEDMPHVWFLAWAADYPDQNNFVHEVFSAEEGRNNTRAAPTHFEELTKQAQTEPDPEKRKALYREAEWLLVEEEARIAPLVHYSAIWVTKPWLAEVFHPLTVAHLDIWSIDWEAKKAARGG